jgi:hypothetical protein
MNEAVSSVEPEVKTRYWNCDILFVNIIYYNAYGEVYSIQHYVIKFAIKWLWIFLILIGLEGSLLPLTVYN